MDEEVVPELSAQLHQDVAPGPRLERGDLRVEGRAAHDAGCVLQRGQILPGDGVGDHELLCGAEERRELTPDRGTTVDVRIGQPVGPIGHERRTPLRISVSAPRSNSVLYSSNASFAP